MTIESHDVKSKTKNIIGKDDPRPHLDQLYRRKICTHMRASYLKTRILKQGAGADRVDVRSS